MRKEGKIFCIGSKRHRNSEAKQTDTEIMCRLGWHLSGRSTFGFRQGTWRYMSVQPQRHLEYPLWQVHKQLNSYPSFKMIRISGRAAYALYTAPSSTLSSSIASYSTEKKSKEVLDELAVSRYKTYGRSSVSGVVATVFGATGFVGKYVVNSLGLKAKPLLSSLCPCPSQVFSRFCFLFLFWRLTSSFLEYTSTAKCWK